MKLLLSSVLLFTITASVVSVFQKFTYANNNDPGEPLILTPLIDANQIKKARNLSEVHHQDFHGVKSYSGFLTVNKQFESNLFFWFFPAKENYASAPVVLWLQGGPGGSSLFGLFVENGPFVVKEENNLTLRDYSWHKQHSVLYIDNPAGTGFSYTSPGGYCTDESQIAHELYVALLQFFKLFHEIQKNDFFVTGESYAGKYIPAVAHTILESNPKAELKINIRGVAVGDGWTDPVHQYQYSAYLYQAGLIDENTRTEAESQEQKWLEEIKDQEWEQAWTTWNSLLDAFRRLTGIHDIYNYLFENDPTHELALHYTDFIERNDVRAAIHVGNLTYNLESDDVYQELRGDMMKSVAPWVSEILSHIRVLIYNGQVDMIVPYPLTENYLKHLNFSSAEKYKTAARNPWYADGELAGYVKVAGNLTEVMVRNAGHMAPFDQPKWMYNLLYRFTRNLPLDSAKKSK